MAARVLLLLNPLDVSRRRSYELEPGVELRAWLAEHEPETFSVQRAVYVNGRPLSEVEPYHVADGDEILIAFAPGWTTIAYYVLEAIIAAAISYVITKIFAPGRPKAANTPSPSQVYGLSAPTNQARLGQPIPVIYGSVIAVPDFAAQPYVEYTGNDQFFSALLCIGQGQHDVVEMILGNSTAADLGTDIAQWWAFQPADHASTFGVIQSATGVRENVVTSSNVADQELIASNQTGTAPTFPTWFWQATTMTMASTKPTIPPAYDLSGCTTDAQRLAVLPANPAFGVQVTAYYGPSGALFQVMTYTACAYFVAQQVPAYSLIPAASWPAGSLLWCGPFESCKSGQRGSRIDLDFVFANGLFTMDGGGNLGTCTVQLVVEYTPVDDNNQPTGAAVQVNQQFSAAQNTPQRFTRSIAVPSGRYLVRAARTSTSDGKASTSDRCIWSGLKFQIDAPPAGTKVYGNVTLVAVRLKASNGVSESASSSIRFRVQRRLAPLGSGAPAATQNPADAFVDIVTAPYGANRPVNGDELDLAELANARAKWVGWNGFNAVFDQPSTVWEALTLSVQTVNAAPLPIGSRFSLIYDGPQAVASQVFTDANIAAGSLSVNYDFDAPGSPAGIRVEYRDPRTFSAAALLVPVDAPDYTTISLFGCTDATVAQKIATLAGNKRRLQRASIQFGTELEGLNCLPGDRIGVQAGMVKWAQGARVERAEGRHLWLDHPLDWTAVAGSTFAVQLRDTQGVPHRIVGVTCPTGNPNELQLPVDPPFTLLGFGDTAEATTLSFGVQDDEITDWSVTKITPQGSSVQIEAVNYDPAIWPAGLVAA